MNRTRYFAVAVALAALMVSSAWLGAALALRWQNRALTASGNVVPARGLLERVDRMQQALGLTQEQRQRLAPALERARADVRTLAGDSARRALEIRRSLRAEIDPLLTPAQRARANRLAPATRWSERLGSDGQRQMGEGGW
ncbi:MAG: hypothetical protein IT580_09595 [Verrucomicrobiales bacterium]|nr:hypothetical protein [Verrucomicrobiales bacterium]